MRDQVLEAIDHAVLCSVPMLAIMSNAEPAIGYALCTDNALGGIYVAGYTASDVSMFHENNYRYRPAEWPRSLSIQEASNLLNEWVYLQSLNDVDGLEPGDDHLRPWKADVNEWKREISDRWVEAQLQWQEFQSKRSKNVIKHHLNRFWSLISSSLSLS